MSAWGGELDAGTVGKWQGNYWRSREAQRCGVTQNRRAGLGVISSGFEFADGRAGQNQELERLEQFIHAVAKIGVALALAVYFFAGERRAPGKAVI